MECIKCRNEIVEGDEFIFLDEVYELVDGKAKHQDDRIVVNEHGDYAEIELCQTCLRGIGCRIGNSK